MRCVLAVCALASIELAALDVVWQQSSWTKTFIPHTAAGLSNAAYYISAGTNLFFTGFDHRSNNVVILAPAPSGRLTPFVTNMSAFTTATLSTYVSPGYLIQAYDPFVSADRDGSVRVGYTATGNGSVNAFTHGRYLNSTDKHIAITEHTNLFVLFMAKTDAPTVIPSKFNIVFQYGNDAWSWSMSQYVSNFLFPSRDWTINAGQFNISTNILRHTTYNPPGTVQTSHRMVLWWNFGNYVDHPTASALIPISNSIWLDDMIFTHQFMTNGVFTASPFASPRYHLSGGVVHRLRSIRSVYLGGYIGLTNTNGGGCTMITNMDNPNRYAPDALVRMQVRSGISYADILKRKWAGSNAYDMTENVTNGFTNTALADNITRATNLGLFASNAMYYQYRVWMSSAIQGVTPVLTNAVFVFSSDPTAETFFRSPLLLSRSIAGSTMTMFISNFYDPIVTRIAAYDIATGAAWPLTVTDMEDAPFSSVRRVVIDLSVPFGDHSLLISNQNDAYPVIVTNAFMFGVPSASPIDLSGMRRTYVPVNNRITLTLRFNIAGSRDMAVDIYSIGGRLMHRVAGKAVPGDVPIEWTPRGSLPLGMYIYQVTLRSESGTVDRKRGMFAVVK